MTPPLHLVRLGRLVLATLLAASPALSASTIRGTHPAGGPHGIANAHAEGYLGIGFRDLPDEQLGQNPKNARPIEVVLVDHDGPAYKAGLRLHDIIVTANGQPVAGSKSFSQMLHNGGAGFQVVLSLQRDGHPLTFSARLADREALEREMLAHLSATDDPPPTDSPAEIMPVAAPAVLLPAPTPKPHGTLPGQSFLERMLPASSNYTGINCERMEPQLAGYFGTVPGTGLLIHSIEPASPAAMVGLRAGDVLLRADGSLLRTSSDWSRHIRNAKGQAVVVTILRDHREQNFTLQPGLKHRSMLEWPRL